MTWSLNIRPNTQLTHVSSSSYIIFYIVMWAWNLVMYIVLYQGEVKNLLILDIDGQCTTYVFSSKVTQIVHLNLHLHWCQGIQPIQKSHLRNGFTFGIIHKKWRMNLKCMFLCMKGPSLGHYRHLWVNVLDTNHP